ncbi:thiolase family protein [Mycolicibacterium thermoresistibile]|uniref:Lipid-transfer protein n=2 Tax=Mycolicibacterium thermoresistibile TaxID=1797 RepID=G7CHZ4_MYCT3|nr:thiolase family protein [Mycolicibacterium thermoresistibile]EHI12454.1 lipid-transfer protein [Mycolicibacterium thermoresistibile ATCC 19527]MCV7187363.1 thiolase family protein [Mycolicibacterium thermoresistibile]GAT17220.1 lipid-transfer protein [Mycolicibacterium thermoresistibile]SNW19626.1 lipid-transfer protein [Mycolicibacterium thermoresistibile]
MSSSNADIAIIGVGIHPFGRYENRSALEMGAVAIGRALRDAGVGWTEVGSLYAGSLEVANPEAVTGLVGMTGIPARATLSGCATGNSLLTLAARDVQLGEVDIAVGVGLDKHPRGAFGADPSVAGLPQWYGDQGMFLTTHYFGTKIMRYMHDWGISEETLARIAVKNFSNGALTDHAWRRNAMSLETVLSSPVVNAPLRQYMYCNPNEGAAAVVICRADVAKRYTDSPIYLRATALRSRQEGAYELLRTSIELPIVPGTTAEAAKAAYELAGIGPEDVDVAQLQDTDAGSEIIHMAETGLCKDGEQEALLREGATNIGGRLPINTDGGLLANGEPVGASGLRQVYELVHQLRGTAGDRQVPNDPRVALAQLYGSPGTAAVAILSK